MLVLINDDNDFVDSTEELFLDINHKLQPLEIADIFKGYCFKNCVRESHNDLKDSWVKLKICGKGFDKFGYKGLSKYLYYYLLSLPESRSINEDLTNRGSRVHYLEGKDTDQTKSVLDNMIEYGENVLNFTSSLSNTDYRLDDLYDARTPIIDPQKSDLIAMCKKIVYSSSALYQKFPFFILISYIKKDPQIKEQINSNSISSIITNMYLYYSMFVSDASKKTKGSTDHTIINLLQGTEENKGSLLLSKVKELRKSMRDEFIMQENYNREAFFALSSAIDFFNTEDNSISDIYNEDAFNREHFIVHDSCFVIWKSETQEFNIFETEYIESSNYLKKQFSSFKGKTINNLIIDSELNQQLGSFDIVYKIAKMKEKYAESMPKLLNAYIEHIESLDAYQILHSKKDEDQVSSENIQDLYFDFYKAYFDNESQSSLLVKITNIVKDTL